MLPLWVYLAVAVLIAGLAFIAGQLVPGLGMVVAALGSTGWVAFNVRRASRIRHRC